MSVRRRRQRLEVLVSLRKGTVVRTSASMTELLGYPADMWVGRSFIDYVYPKDRASFTNTINGMGLDVDGMLSDKGKPGRDCRPGASVVIVSPLPYSVLSAENDERMSFFGTRLFKLCPFPPGQVWSGQCWMCSVCVRVCICVSPASGSVGMCVSRS